jgi:hypothetical protein
MPPTGQNATPPGPRLQEAVQVSGVILAKRSLQGHGIYYTKELGLQCLQAWVKNQRSGLLIRTVCRYYNKERLGDCYRIKSKS